MKKHLIFVSTALLTIAPVKLLGMEENQTEKQQIELAQVGKAVEKLWSLVGFSYEQSGVSYEEFLNPQIPLSELPNFINTTENCSDLRDGIFALTTILALPSEESSDLKNLRISMYNRLTELLVKPNTDEKKAKSAAKKLCCGVIDYISDEEKDDKEDNYKRTHYLKYLEFKNREQQARTDLNTLNASLAALQNRKETSGFELQVLEKKVIEFKQTCDDLGKLFIYNQKESEALKTAQNLLNKKALEQLDNMQQQGKWLAKEIDLTNDCITNLTKELPTLTIAEEIKTKNEEINKARIKLTNLTTALSYLNKDLAEANKQTGVLTNLAWTLGLYNYGNLTEDKKKN